MDSQWNLHWFFTALQVLNEHSVTDDTASIMKIVISWLFDHDCAFFICTKKKKWSLYDLSVPKLLGEQYETWYSCQMFTEM